MKFLKVSAFHDNPAQVWRDLPREKEMVVTRNGRPIAVLTAVNESNLEECLAAWQSARATQALPALQLASVRRGTDKMTMEEIDAVIAETRRARREIQT